MALISLRLGFVGTAEVAHRAVPIQ